MDTGIKEGSFAAMAVWTAQNVNASILSLIEGRAKTLCANF
jgi:hypothetical protein